MKYLAENGNWKGGVSLIRCADDLLTTTKQARAEINRKLLASYGFDPITGCWNWTGSVFKSNGRACLNLGVRLLASRMMYVAVYRKPLGDLCVLHTCDNVLCVRPAHLRAGTNQDNSDDMVAKGRQLDQRGSKNHCAKLDEALVLEIREKLAEGYSQRWVAIDYGVSFQAINLIHLRKRWAHI